MTMTVPTANGVPDLTTPEFWRRPLAARMADFATIREASPFTYAEAENPMTGAADSFYAVTRMADVLEISRNPKTFCSGQGSTSIVDMPVEALEYFGSFIQMDEPKHARQRGIVGRSFTPKRLADVVDSVQSICTEVVDEICEKGEVDLVETISAPFPLMVICDMMGIPRSEFKTVLDATNVILGAGDPEMMGGVEDPMQAFFGAGVTLIGLMNELAEFRRKNPTNDLTSALVNSEIGEEMLSPEELGPFFILLAVAGNDTTRTATSLGFDLLSKNPDQRKIWTNDFDGVASTAVEEIVRVATPVVFMRRTATEDVTLSGQDFSAGDRFVMFYGAANRDPRVFTDPDKFDVLRSPNPHVGFGGPGPHFCLGAHLARRELGLIFKELYTRLPDIEPTGEPVPLDAMGVPLVGGIKRFPVKFTPTKRVGK